VKDFLIINQRYDLSEREKKEMMRDDYLTRVRASSSPMRVYTYSTLSGGLLETEPLLHSSGPSMFTLEFASLCCE
jgi:hypothetical protein